MRSIFPCPIGLRVAERSGLKEFLCPKYQLWLIY